MPDKQRCETCRWWDTSTTSASNPDVTAMCRRRPPAVDDRTGLAMWPMTEDVDWCGEWQQDPDQVEPIVYWAG